MSVTYLLFFLCFSFHAYCTVLPLSNTQDMELENKKHFSIKTDNINDFESFPNHFPMMNEDSKMKTWLVNTQKSRKELSTNKKMLKAMRKDSSTSETKTYGSVSCSVIHKNLSEKNTPSEKNPEFDLDYSPPKTHPPHHN
ncbi:unnamed protein product [Trifolium pratense]|uniref:Uncharacterized protein n=1 Tax=Trifolium pratense TaxID=57577 RepID=A0ACB0LJY7_TRIPR|nr:unnamed protein product [Trifolium pratense]